MSTRPARALLLCHLALPLTLLAIPAFAADYTPWPQASRPTLESIELAQKSCCKRCDKGQPCGNTYISKKSACKSPLGCAC